MSRLKEKLSVFERNCDMVLDSQVVLIISALRKALEQRNIINQQYFKETTTLGRADMWDALFEVQNQLDAEILQILEGKE